MDIFSRTIDLKPTITVKDRSKESYEDALERTKNAIYEKMYNVNDYYCEQISSLDHSALTSEHEDMEPLAFWSELKRYTAIQFEEKTPLFHKYHGDNNFVCYCVLLDYDKVQLPWPDGYKDPESRVGGLAPLGLSDNYFFYAKDNTLNWLDFGTCANMESELNGDGAAFNKAMEPVAKANYEVGKYVPGIAYMRDAFEKIVKAKHGNCPLDTLSVVEILDSFANLMRSKTELHDYSLQILPTVDKTLTNFPQQFGIYKNDQPICLEVFFDSLYF